MFQPQEASCAKVLWRRNLFKNRKKSSAAGIYQARGRNEKRQDLCLKGTHILGKNSHILKISYYTMSL
jgi:hypothetical protein